MRQNIFQSTIFRIIAVIIAVVLPVNVMTLVLSNIAVRSDRERIAGDIQSALDANATALEETLTRATRRLTYLSLVETDFVALANATEQTSAQVIGSYLGTVKQSLNNMRVEYPWIDLFYYQFPQADYIVCAGYPGIPFQDCRDFIRQVSAKEAQGEATWAAYELNGISILLSFRSWNNMNFGVMINLERLLGKLDVTQREGRTTFFMRADGTPDTGVGQRFLQEKGGTLEALSDLKNHEVFTAQLPRSDLMLVEVVDWTLEEHNLSSTIATLQWLSIVMTIIVIPLLLLYMRRWIIRPLNRLFKAIDKIEQGDIDYRIKSVKEGHEFDQINSSFNRMMEQVKALKIDVYDREIERNNIRMRYLSQQVQPHFILNAMNIIYSYEPEEYELIQKMVACIAKYFRYIVKVNADFVTLRQELEHIENYFEIQRARFPGLFDAVVTYGDDLGNALIPPLLVQNFAENAIKHSLQIGQTVSIHVRAERYEAEGVAKMRILLTDTGPGIPDALLAKIDTFQQTGVPQEGLGVGIQNAIERMKYLYGELTLLHFGRGEDQTGTTVTIILPIYYEKSEQKEAIDDDHFTGG